MSLKDIVDEMEFNEPFRLVRKEIELNRKELREIRLQTGKTNIWLDAFSNASMWSHIFQIAGLVLLALILWRVW